MPIFDLTSKISINVQIIDLIASKNEDEFTYVNTKEYNNSREVPKSLVDAYTFYVFRCDIYLAFYITKSKDGWVIKSFHDNNNCELLSIGNILGIGD